jgi:hypothetical protein
MYEEIVGLIAVMLIVYLFIMVLRPERKFDRLFEKDFSAPGTHIRSETSTDSNEHSGFSASNGHCGTTQSGMNHGNSKRRTEDEENRSHHQSF